MAATLSSSTSKVNESTLSACDIDDDNSNDNDNNSNSNDFNHQSLLPSFMTVSTFESMNPRRRHTMEDVHCVHAPGTWNCPDVDLAYFGVYDGHGGREMVEYLDYFLASHVANELHVEDQSAIPVRLERAFLMADIHAAQCGVSSSGATVVICLVKVSSSDRQFPLVFGHLDLVACFALLAVFQCSIAAPHSMINPCQP